MIRCCFPNCVLEEHEDGDHRFGRPEKPWGELRQLQAFQPAYTWDIPCDAEPTLFSHSVAIALYSDMMGFGWMLCLDCARKFVSFTTEIPSREGTAGPSSPQSVPGTLASGAAAASPVVKTHACGDPDCIVPHPAPHKTAPVIEFRPRKLKAGIS